MSLGLRITIDNADDAIFEEALRKTIVETTERILREDGHNIIDTLVAKHKMLAPDGLLLGEMVNKSIDKAISAAVGKAVTQVPKKVMEIVDKAVERQVTRVMEHYHAQSVQAISRALNNIHSGDKVNKAAKASIEQRVSMARGDVEIDAYGNPVNWREIDKTRGFSSTSGDPDRCVLDL